MLIAFGHVCRTLHSRGWYS